MRRVLDFDSTTGVADLEARWGGPLNYLREIGVTDETLDKVRVQFLD